MWQGFTLSPLISLKSIQNKIFTKTLETQTAEIRIGGETINNLHYAYDTVLMTESIHDVQNSLNKS